MTYRVEITRRAKRDLAPLDSQERKRLAKKIDRLAQDPRPAGCRKLSGHGSLYRIRSGDYRVVYEVRDDVLVVLVIMARHRGDIYRALERLLRK